MTTKLLLSVPWTATPFCLVLRGLGDYLDFSGRLFQAVIETENHIAYVIELLVWVWLLNKRV